MNCDPGSKTVVGELGSCEEVLSLEVKKWTGSWFYDLLCSFQAAWCNQSLGQISGLSPSRGSRSSSHWEDRLASSSILYFGNSNHFWVTGRNAQKMRMKKAIAVMTPTIVLIIDLAPPCARCCTCFGHTSRASVVRHRSGGSSMRAWNCRELLLNRTPSSLCRRLTHMEVGRRGFERSGSRPVAASLVAVAAYTIRPVEFGCFIQLRRRH
jgi:hypothetical protein